LQTCKPIGRNTVCLAQFDTITRCREPKVQNKQNQIEHYFRFTEILNDPKVLFRNINNIIQIYNCLIDRDDSSSHLVEIKAWQAILQVPAIRRTPLLRA